MILVGWHFAKFNDRPPYYPVGWEHLADINGAGYYLLVMVLHHNGQRFGCYGADGQVETIRDTGRYAEDGEYFPFYHHRQHGLEPDLTPRLIEWWNFYRRLEPVHAEMLCGYTAALMAGAALGIANGADQDIWQPVEQLLSDPPLLPGQSRRWWY